MKEFGRMVQRRLAVAVLLVLTALSGCKQCGTDDDDDDTTTSGMDASVLTDGGVVGPSHSLVLSDPNARSCEVLLTDTDAVIHTLTFADALDGRFLREGNHVAAAFLSRTDQTMPADAVRLVLESGQTANSVVVTSASCFDRAGARLNNATVTLAR